MANSRKHFSRMQEVLYTKEKNKTFDSKFAHFHLQKMKKRVHFIFSTFLKIRQFVRFSFFLPIFPQFLRKILFQPLTNCRLHLARALSFTVSTYRRVPRTTFAFFARFSQEAAALT